MRGLMSGFCFLIVTLAAAASPLRAQQLNQPGHFDYYLFTLSWSPEFCHGHPSAPECGGHHGFMVHGLWPQNNSGPYPHDCVPNPPTATDTSAVADIMPQDIIEHEWEKHGTCTGLTSDQYFALIRKVFNSIKIPSQLVSPSQSFTMSPAALKDDFAKSNPGLTRQDMAIQLMSKEYLSAAEICLTKDDSPKFMACSADVKDINGGTFIVPPVQ